MKGKSLHVTVTSLVEGSAAAVWEKGGRGWGGGIGLIDDCHSIVL